MYVCMRVCTKSFLKTTTNSLCVCAHLVNKADSDSYLIGNISNIQLLWQWDMLFNCSGHIFLDILGRHSHENKTNKHFRFQNAASSTYTFC